MKGSREHLPSAASISQLRNLSLQPVTMVGRVVVTGSGRGRGVVGGSGRGGVGGVMIPSQL